MFIIWFSIFLDFSFLNHPIFAYSQSIDIADNLKPNMLPNFNDWEWKIASSYDKAGGNSDGKGYLKKEGNKYVLMEVANSSGFVSRIWMAGEVEKLGIKNPILEVYIDSPVNPIYINLEDIDQSSIEINVPNIYFDTHNSSGGLVSYLPIKFNDSIKVVTSTEPNYYQINYTTTDQNLSLDINKVNNIFNSWGNVNMGVPVNFLINNGNFEAISFKIDPGSVATISEKEGQGVVTGLIFPSSLINSSVNDLWLKITYPDTNDFAYFPLNLLFTKDFENYIPQKPPLNNIDSYVVSPSGKEIAIRGDRVWIREPEMENPDKPGKGGGWYSLSLVDYFKGSGSVPPNNIDSYAIGTNGKETVIKDGLFWSRSDSFSPWTEGVLSNYWNNNVGFSGNTNNIDVYSINHLDYESIISGNQYWFRKTGGDKFWSSTLSTAWGFTPINLQGIGDFSTGEIIVADGQYMFRGNDQEPWQVQGLDSAFNRYNYHSGSLFFGKKDDTGESYITWPIPYWNGVKIQLENKGSQMVNSSVEIFSSEGVYDKDNSGYFTTQYNMNEESDINSVHLAADIEGKGKFVGLILKADGTPDSRYGRTFLEGDDLIYVDGEKVGNGTGIEDIFNAGWYFLHGPFYQPLHGAIRTPNSKIVAPKYDALLNNNRDQETIMYRHFLLDAINFEQSLRFEIEYGPTPRSRINRGQSTRFESLGVVYKNENPNLDINQDGNFDTLDADSFVKNLFGSFVYDLNNDSKTNLLDLLFIISRL